MAQASEAVLAGPPVSMLLCGLHEWLLVLSMGNGEARVNLSGKMTGERTAVDSGITQCHSGMVTSGWSLYLSEPQVPQLSSKECDRVISEVFLGLKGNDLKSLVQPFLPPLFVSI